MTIIFDTTPGWLYILHFDRPLGNLANVRGQAAHYLGFAIDVRARIADHAAGRGAAITQAAVAAGIGFEAFYRAGTRATERQFKTSQKNTPSLCPCCRARRGLSNRYGFQPLAQLALALIEDFPALPPARMDYAEIAQLRDWRLLRASLLPAGDLAAVDAAL